MSSFLIWNKETKECICCMEEILGNEYTLENLTSFRTPDWETIYDGRKIEQTLTTGQFKSQYFINENNEIISLLSIDTNRIESIKSRKLISVKTAFERDCIGSVLCLVGDTEYTMDAGEYYANKLNSGIVFAEMMGVTSMDIRDFYNVTTTGVSLVDAKEIVKQVGLDYLTKWGKKNIAQDRIYAVTLETENWESVLEGIEY